MQRTGNKSSTGPATLQRYTPTEKLVAKVLDLHGTMTESRLASETLLTTETVRDALATLEHDGHVERAPAIGDVSDPEFVLDSDFETLEDLEPE